MPRITDFADIYQEIAVRISPQTAVEIHRLFKGQQVIFPKKLYTKEYIHRYIRENCNGKNLQEPASMFGYSDRRIRQILKQNHTE